MAGHSKFKNIMHHKQSQDEKKARLHSKCMKMIMSAWRADPNVQTNSRLQKLIKYAYEVGLSKDRIDKFLAKSPQQVVGDILFYAASGPSGLCIVVEVITDNPNRTYGNVRTILSRHGYKLMEVGATKYLFNHYGEIVYKCSVVSADDLLEVLLPFDVVDYVEEDGVYRLFVPIESLHSQTKKMESVLGEALSVNLICVPNATISLSEEHCLSFRNVLQVLFADDDVQNVFSNYDKHNFILKDLGVLSYS